MTKNRFTVKTSFLSRQSKFFENQFLSCREIAGVVLLKYFISVKSQKNRLLNPQQNLVTKT